MTDSTGKVEQFEYTIKKEVCILCTEEMNNTSHKPFCDECFKQVVERIEDVRGVILVRK